MSVNGWNQDGTWVPKLVPSASAWFVEFALRWGVTNHLSSKMGVRFLEFLFRKLKPSIALVAPGSPLGAFWFEDCFETHIRQWHKWVLCSSILMSPKIWSETLWNLWNTGVFAESEACMLIFTHSCVLSVVVVVSTIMVIIVLSFFITVVGAQNDKTTKIGEFGPKWDQKISGDGMGSWTHWSHCVHLFHRPGKSYVVPVAAASVDLFGIPQAMQWTTHCIWLPGNVTVVWSMISFPFLQTILERLEMAQENVILYMGAPS